MTCSATLAAAELNAQRARSRFCDTAATMKARLEPSRLIGDAVTGARSGAAEFAHAVRNKARANPVVATTIAGGAVLLLARRRLLRTISQTLRHLKA